MVFKINRVRTCDYTLTQLTKIRTQTQIEKPIVLRYALSEVILWEDKKLRNFFEDYILGLM